MRIGLLFLLATVLLIQLIDYYSLSRDNDKVKALTKEVKQKLSNFDGAIYTDASLEKVQNVGIVPTCPPVIVQGLEISVNDMNIPNTQTSTYTIADLLSFYDQYPKDEQVMIYWPLSRYHNKGNQKILGGSKVSIYDKDKNLLKPHDLAHFKSLTEIMHGAKNNTKQFFKFQGGEFNKEYFVLICTKDIWPTKKDPPIYDLLKSVKIDNEEYNVLMELKTGDGLSYLLVNYNPAEIIDGAKNLMIEKKEVKYDENGKRVINITSQNIPYIFYSEEGSVTLIASTENTSKG